jgi:hypothetical protein
MFEQMAMFAAVYTATLFVIMLSTIAALSLFWIKTNTHHKHHLA